MSESTAQDSIEKRDGASRNAAVRRRYPAAVLALMTEPGKLIQRECLEEGQSYLDYIASDVRDALDEYEGLADDEYALSILSARWDDCHKANGYPKQVPADLLNFDKSYIAGDFVKTDPDDPDPYDEGGGDEGGEGIEKQTR